MRGWFGARPVDLELARTPDDGWTLIGAAMPDARDHEDLDLGFTPATNLLPIRRAGLAVGEAAELLETTAEGLVRHYPRLWVAEGLPLTGAPDTTRPQR